MELILNICLETFIVMSQVMKHRTWHNCSIMWCFLDDFPWKKFSCLKSHQNSHKNNTNFPAHGFLMQKAWKLTYFRSEFPSESNTKSPTWCVAKLYNHYSFLNVWNVLEAMIDRRPLHHLCLTSQLCLRFCAFVINFLLREAYQRDVAPRLEIQV
jgi:hypothetical protein